MKCDCNKLSSEFFDAVEIYFLGSQKKPLSRPDPDVEESLKKLSDLAKECGYERDEQGDWARFPKRDKALQSLTAEYEVIQEHDDGDLTIRIPAHHALAVVTTEGDIFTKPE